MKTPMHRLLVTTLLTAMLLGGTPLDTHAIVVKADRLPPAQLVEETRADLAAIGCLEQPLGNDIDVDVPPGKPYRIGARDRVPETIFYCSPATATSLTPVQGEVAGAISDWLDCSSISAWGPTSLQWSLCWGTGFVGDQVAKSVPLQALAGTTSDWAIGGLTLVTRAVAGAVAAVGLIVLRVAFSLLVFALATPTFITNPLVTTGWTFVQGIANLGFMLALLFIAFATTLRIEGFSASRQLPRLLIAAVLINFSLIIAGVIIDVTRVLMAILVNTLGTVPLDQLPSHLMKNSGLVESVAGVKSFGVPKYDSLIVALYNAIVIWTLALGFLTISLTLIVRYIALILLLIVSPVAYLGYALPNTEPYAKQWWTNFFKFVFAGPIALFFLILAIRVDQLGTSTGAISSGTAGAKLLHAITLTVMLVIASVASLKLADKGSAAAVGAFSKQARKTGLWAGKKTVGGATYLPRKFVANQSRDAAGIVKSRGRDFLKKTPGIKHLVPARRDDKGKLKPGEESLATKTFGKIPYTGRKRTQYNDIRSLGAITSGNVTSDALSAPRLSSKHATDALMAGAPKNDRLAKVKALIDVGSLTQVKSLLKNREFLSGLDDGERNDLQIAVQSKVGGVELRADPTSPTGRSPHSETYGSRDINRTVERLVDTFDQIDNP